MISDERLEEIIGALCTDSLYDYEQVFDSIKNGEIGYMAKELLALRKAREGWKLAPVEPTRQMMSQGHFALGGTDRGKFRRIYQAMLAAAPDSK